MPRETMTEIMRGVTYDVTPKPKFVTHNTVQYYRGGEKVIRLHHTDIIWWSVDGKTMTLNSGGWQTITTKDRINKYSPVRVFSNRGMWYVCKGEDTVPFFDGITIVNGKLPVNKTAKEEASHRKLIADINKFVSKMTDCPPKPSSGDCFLCQFSASATPVQVGPAKAVQYLPQGDAQVHHQQRDINPHHLLSHIKEGYLHGTLVLNAMRWAGRGDLAVVWAFEDPRYAKQWAKRDLRRYLRSQLGLPT